MSLRSLWFHVFAGAFALLTFSPSASAQRLQVDADLNLAPAYSFGLGILSSGTTVRGGILLFDRLAIETGLGFFADLDTDDDTYHSRTFRIPLEAAWYFADAKAHALVPSMRIGASYGQTLQHNVYNNGKTVESQELRHHVLGATVLVGLTYFANEHIGVSVQGGPTYSKFYSDYSNGLMGLQKSSTQSLGLEYRLGIVLRS